MSLVCSAKNFARQRIRKTDWGLAIGFAILLIFICIIGFLGIAQIHSLTRQIETITTYNIPKYQSIVAMKNANTVYALHVRSFLSWHFSRYLDAAKFSAGLEDIQRAADYFDEGLQSYAALAGNAQEKQLAAQVRVLCDVLRASGNAILTLAREGNTDDRQNKQSVISRMLVGFDQHMYAINEFLDTTLQAPNLEALQVHLRNAQKERDQRTAYLSWILGIVFLLGGYIAVVVYRERRHQQERLVSLTQRAIQSQERERQNLSFQVHNQMGQDLSALKIYCGIMEQKKGTCDELAESKKILTGLIDKMHNISELLSPPGLEDLGLVPMLDSLGMHYRPLTNAEIVFQCCTDIKGLSQESSLTLYRIAQEALNNSVKYAQAAHISVTLSHQEGRVLLIVADDGKGFEYSYVAARPTRRKEDAIQLGLVGLRERVEILGGVMRIKTAPGKGTRIEVELSL